MISSVDAKPVVGKYILDTISVGMYNNPLMVLREYVQNSADAIDLGVREGFLLYDEAKIEINIDGRSKSVIIRDNGAGIKKASAATMLHDLGKSLKKKAGNRGFRGIGRLGGLGYCDELRFAAKARGEKQYSVSMWDCKKLKALVKDESDALDASAIIQEVVDFSQPLYEGSPSDHFFSAEMKNVRSAKDILLDVPAIKLYLAEVAPVPFDKKKFSYAERIEKKLREKVPSYETYNIYVNGEQIFKPYKDEVRISQQNIDTIREIQFKEFQNGAGLLAFTWLADLNLLGSINPSEHVGGVRLRSGNILVGHKDILSNFFREERFNSYVLGEVHVMHKALILNSRRDDFEDNPYKEEFYNCFIKEIGLPFSKKIREMSNLRSAGKLIERQSFLKKSIDRIVDSGYCSSAQRDCIISELKQLKQRGVIFNTEEIGSLSSRIMESSHCLDKATRRMSANKKALLKLIFDVIYKDSKDKKEAENIIRRIFHRVAR